MEKTLCPFFSNGICNRQESGGLTDNCIQTPHDGSNFEGCLVFGSLRSAKYIEKVLADRYGTTVEEVLASRGLTQFVWDWKSRQ